MDKNIENNADKTTTSQRLIEEWYESKKWVDGFTEDFEDLDSLADGVPLSHVKGAPVVGSVTLLRAVRQIPQGAAQQVPVFSAEVNGTKHSHQAFFSSFLLRKHVFNQDTFGKGILSTIQTAGEAALTRGFQVLMASLGVVGSDFGSSMKTVHYDDFAIEKGTLDFSDSSFFDVRTRVSPSRLDKLIEAAESNPETTWDVEALKELREAGPNAEDAQFSGSPMREGGDHDGKSSQFTIITRYSVGPYHDIEVFATSIDRPLRKYQSRSKFGYPRLLALVIDPSATSAFGVSRARLASPMANYANIYLQSTAKMQLINADPPVHQRGRYLTPVRLRRGALWKSTDPNADTEVVELSNTTLTQFRNVLDYIDSQILSTMGVGRARNARSTSAYINTEQAKADNQETELSVTQVVSIIENLLRQYGLLGLDLYVSERSGEESVIVDDECKDDINNYDEQRFVPTPEMPVFIPAIGDDNRITINWDEFYEGIETWTVNIDLSIGKKEMEAAERSDIQDAVTVASQTTDPADPVGMARKRQLEDVLLEKMVPEIKMDENPPLPPQGVM